MSQVDVAGDIPLDPEVAAPETSRRERRAHRDRTKRTQRWWTGVVALLVIAMAAGVTVAAVQARPSPPPLPPAASASAPATIYSPLDVVPDPAVFVDGGRAYLYASGNGTFKPPNVPVRILTGSTTLNPPTDAMPTLPTWSWGWIWTPDVIKAGNHYVMWFTTVDVHHPLPAGGDGANAECIGNATSDSPLGPFVPGPAPAICQKWGSIDTRVFTDADGTRWMIWKEDSNSDKAQVIPTTIWSQRLGANGTSLLGKPKQIAVASQPWEHTLVEAPDMVLSAGKYYLFFSGERSFEKDTGIGYELCKGPTGPCRDTRTRPWLASNAQGPGPGEESLFTQDGATWLLYSPEATYTQFLHRYLAIARVAFGPKGPYLAKFDGRIPGVAPPPFAPDVAAPFGLHS